MNKTHDSIVGFFYIDEIPSKLGFVAQRFYNYMILKVLIVFRSKIKSI